MNLGRADGHELEGDGPRVVMCHTVMWCKSDIVASLDFLARGESNRVSLHNLLGEGLGRGGRCFQGGEDGGGGGVFELGLKGSLGPRCGSGIPIGSCDTSDDSLGGQLTASSRRREGQTPPLRMVLYQFSADRCLEKRVAKTHQDKHSSSQCWWRDHYHTVKSMSG